MFITGQTVSTPCRGVGIVQVTGVTVPYIGDNLIGVKHATETHILWYSAEELIALS